MAEGRVPRCLNRWNEKEVRVPTATGYVTLECIQEVYHVSTFIVFVSMAVCDNGTGCLRPSYFTEAMTHSTTATLALAQTNSGVSRRLPSRILDAHKKRSRGRILGSIQFMPQYLRTGHPTGGHMSDRSASSHICKSLINRLLSGPAASFCRLQAEVQGPARLAHGPRFADRARHEYETNFVLRIMVLLGFLSLVTGALAARNTAATGLAASVDPFVGTGSGPGGTINLFPGATLPFGMVQLSPDTESKGYGYHYDQGTIQGFSMTHMSGVGCANEGDVFFTATTGPVLTQVSDFQSPYSHSQEAATPGYYRVVLSRWGVNVGLTATDRTGMAQFSFPGPPYRLPFQVPNVENGRSKVITK